MPPTTQNIFQTLAKKVGVIVVVCLVVLIVAGLYLYNRVAMTDVANVDTATLEQNGDAAEGNTVSIYRQGGRYVIDVVTKEITQTASPTDDILNFAGLPKVMKNERVSVAVRPILVSDDRTKAIVVALTYDETQEPEPYDGSLPILKTEQFICDIVSRTCAISNVLAAAYKASGLPGEWFSYPNLEWERWDATKNVLYGYAIGLAFGSSAPIYTYQIDSGTFKKLTRYSRIGEEGDHAILPAGAFSPSLRNIAAVEVDTSDAMLVVYENGEMLVEAKKFNITAALDVDQQHDIIHAVAWSADENKLVLMSEKKISALDITSGKVTVLYTDTVADNSGSWFDFDSVKLTPNGRYVVFVDYEARTTAYEENKIETVLKSIDLQRGNAVSEVLRETYLGL